jgi:hypothetical protein
LQVRRGNFRRYSPGLLKTPGVCNVYIRAVDAEVSWCFRRDCCCAVCSADPQLTDSQHVFFGKIAWNCRPFETFSNSKGF